MKNTIFTGMATAIVTPMTKTGIDYDALGRFLEYQIENGINAIVVMGTTGENATIEPEDQKEVIRFTVEKVAKRVPVIAGTGTNNTEHVLHNTKNACEVGADAILVVTPYYNKATQNGLYRHFWTVADASTVPVILYNVPGRTGCNLLPKTVARLAEHPNIVGLKDSERDLDRMAACIEIARSREDFTYFCGWAAQSAHALELGADGIVPSTGNFVPKHFQALYEAAVAGNMAEANRLQELTDRMAKVYQAGRPLGKQLAALKCIMAREGLCGKEMFAPLTMLSDEEYASIEEQIAAFDLNL